MLKQCPLILDTSIMELILMIHQSMPHNLTWFHWSILYYRESKPNLSSLFSYPKSSLLHSSAELPAHFKPHYNVEVQMLGALGDP